MPNPVQAHPMPFEALCTLRPRIIAISSSTGGPDALRVLLSGIKGKTLHSAIAITQHLGAGFSTDFIKQIEHYSGMPTSIAEDNLVVLSGHIYVAGDGKHMRIVRKHDRKVILTDDSAPQHHCKPSANPMLESIAQLYCEKALAITLTGMGEDGLEGARTIVEYGGIVVVQNEATSAVWGMPKAVHQAGLAHGTLSLGDLAKLLVKVAT